MQMKVLLIVALGFVVAMFGSHASRADPPPSSPQACDGVDTNLSSARKHEYATLVTKAVTTKIDPSAVKFLNFLESGSWSAAYVSTPVGDDGFFFFQEINGQKHFKDVWGGWADRSEQPDLIKWAQNLGAPKNLAACFADVVTRH